MAYITRRAVRLSVPALMLTLFLFWLTRPQAPAPPPAIHYTPTLSQLPTRAPLPHSCFLFVTRTISLTKVRRTMFDIEQRFNRRHRYPYVFLSEHPFSDEFQTAVRALASAPVRFALIDQEDWQAPAWINHDRVRGDAGFRNMVRYWAAPFAGHPQLAGMRRVWRLEPGAHYTCDIAEDPFRQMSAHQWLYAFAVSLETLPTATRGLWPAALAFLAQHPSAAQNNSLSWLANQARFTGCQFLTNFELVDLAFIRSQPYQALFDFLDRQAGIYYDDWSDAAVRALAAAMFLAPAQVKWLHALGYQHDALSNCPADAESQKRCHCDPAKSSHLLPMSCSARFANATSLDVHALLLKST
ncbi:hypothetical protein IWW55_000805 [Coemansia sp. RSA 2706]|nr:hypothetical protein IWW55_000805 [Coemansia sp. RSA 2706]KAJ2329169.1 hypothetical protein IWW51_000763 [Coemansia sp. RSA 2702]